MATGYTYPVAEGKVTKFKDFALMCARAFGALIEMRDDSLDAPLPKKIEPSDYHLKRAEEAKAELAKVAAMSVERIERASKAAYTKRVESDEQYDKDREAENDRLRRMLLHVRDWEPPTSDHKEMKRFMIDQLESSISKPYPREKIKQLSGAEWQSQELARLSKDIARHSDEYAKECERAANRNEWLQQLRASL